MKIKTYSQNEIVQGCIQNDAYYQRILVDTYLSKLMTVSRRYAPRTEDAEDILQDAFIKIFRAIKNFDPDRGVLESWMRKIVINTALKKLQSNPFLLHRNTEELIDADIVSTLSPSVYDRLLEEDILDVISTLPDGYKQIFNLSVIEGYPHKEIAKMLDIKEGTSRSNLAKAKRLLRKKLIQRKKTESWTKTA